MSAFEDMTSKCFFFTVKRCYVYTVLVILLGGNNLQHELYNIDTFYSILVYCIVHLKVN